MITQSIISIFERGLNKLIEEINLYKDEDSLWGLIGGISNSGGNLCLHLLGNLNFYIGASLGKTAYKRNRDNEFTLKNISHAELIANIETCIVVIKNTLNKLSVADLEKDFPVQIFSKNEKTDFILIHLTTHLTYHLGQINYHRRIVSA